jgi:two-component system, chemotaxis family, protein-glutamate methylesterase/glutaminase
VTVFKPDPVSPTDAPDGAPSGFTCPRCGGSMWELPGESLGFQCRIGHKLSLGGMLAEHGTGRRAKLVEVGRLLAEAAALNRRVAQYAVERGHKLAAERLQEEAAALDERSSEVMQMAVSVLVDPTQA